MSDDKMPERIWIERDNNGNLNTCPRGYHDAEYVRADCAVSPAVPLDAADDLMANLVDPIEPCGNFTRPSASSTSVWCANCNQHLSKHPPAASGAQMCRNPDWEGGVEVSEHSYDKDGFCSYCGNKRPESVSHLSIMPFRAICGANVPNQSTTQVPDNVTCVDCCRYWKQWNDNRVAAALSSTPSVGDAIDAKLEEMRACENGMCCHCIDLLLEVQELRAKTLQPSEREWGLCSTHGKVDPAHRCRDYDGIHSGGIRGAYTQRAERE